MFVRVYSSSVNIEPTHILFFLDFFLLQIISYGYLLRVLTFTSYYSLM